MADPKKKIPKHLANKSNIAKRKIKKYGHVMNYKGESLINKPLKLLTSVKNNRAHGMGGTMDKIVEGAKNITNPSRFAKKVYDAYQLKKENKNIGSPINMKKQYKVKDINNNGKIDGWEQGKYDAINNSATKMKKPKVIKANTIEGKKKYEERAKRLVAEHKGGLKSEKQSATKMGYAMKMGSKENYSPTNFKTKDAMLMADSPMMMNTVNSITEKPKIKYSDGSIEGDTRGIAAGKGSLNPLTINTSGLGNTGSQKSDYTKGYLKGMEYGQNKKKIDRKAKKEERIGNRAENRAARIENRLAKTQKKGERATKAGKLQKARRLQKRKQRLLKK